MELAAHAHSSAPPERVFALLEAGDRWEEWAGPFVPRSRWEVPGDPVGGVGAVRRLGVGRLSSLERVILHEPPHRLGYVVDSRAPYRHYRSQVVLTPTPDGGTDILWRSAFEPIVPGTGRVLRWVLARIVGSFAKNLAKNA